MQRRQFLQNLAWITGGIVTSSYLPSSVLINRKKKIKGSVLTGGKGIANVVVSDGYHVVRTDKKGKYELDIHAEAVAVFVSTPSGYAFTNQKGISRHYHLLKDINPKKSIDFSLVPLGINDNEHQFIIWADPQVKNENDVQKMMNHSVPDVQKLVAAAGAGSLIHGITVGDIVWDNLELFAEYDKAVEKMGIPFFQCLGNHDMDYNKGGDETSDDSFQRAYGPTYYSFNRGKVHYVVMDDVRYLGKDRNYEGFISQNQLNWLRKDLDFVPKDHLVIVCLHIPVHSGVKNNKDLYAVLQDRKVHIMSGHTHYHRNVITGNIYEHNHGTVCGAWWSGPICEDGTPNGYGVYKVKGTELTWHYQSTGKTADHQLTVYVDDMDATQKQMQVNIWNYDPSWKTEYWVDDVSRGALEQFTGYDPYAYKTLLGPGLPKTRAFAEPKKTDHLFKAIVPSSAKEIKVVATDRFGTRFTQLHRVGV